MMGVVGADGGYWSPERRLLPESSSRWKKRTQSDLSIGLIAIGLSACFRNRRTWTGFQMARDS